MNKKLILSGTALTVLLGIGITAMMVRPYVSNCGGNSAALFHVSLLANTARLGAATSRNHSFLFATSNPTDAKQLADNARYHWIKDARFFVTTAPVLEQETQTGKVKRIIVVCDTPYRNVPRQVFDSAPPTHAAGYSDGTAGLISIDEFAALDRSKFKPLDELYPTKRE